MTKYLSPDMFPNVIYEKYNYVRKLSIKKRKEYNQKTTYKDLSYENTKYSILCY